jgi:hypothetical protein
MAKLNMTVEQIQSTLNMITDSNKNDVTLWDDKHYPSAKVVDDRLHALEYPIGSIIITGFDLTTNKRIDPNGKISGTWKLIDKSFKANSTIWDNSSYSPPSDGMTIAWEKAVHTDHSLLVQLGISSKSDITIQSNNSAISLVQLELGKYGVTQLSSMSNSDTYVVAQNIAFASSTSPGTLGAIVSYKIQNDGKIFLIDVVNGGNNSLTLKGGLFISINAIIPMAKPDKMLDNFCDKFYWERIA